jgi:hypothetical protein
MLVNTRARDLERVRGGLPSGISLNDAAVTIRTEMVTVLASWAGLVVEERQVGRPPGRDVRALAKFLGVHVGWLAEHAAAADAAAEIAALVRAAEDMLAPETTVRVELGPCGLRGCGGVVSVIVGRGGDLAPKMVKCDGGHIWPPRQWLLLKHKIEQAMRAPLPGGADRAERFA